MVVVHWKLSKTAFELIDIVKGRSLEKYISPGSWLLWNSNREETCQKWEGKHKLLSSYILDLAQLIPSQTCIKNHHQQLQQQKTMLEKEQVIAEELKWILEKAYLPSVFHVFTFYLHSIFSI